MEHLNREKITLIDGISILFIVLFHEMGGINRPDAIFLVKYLATFGLVLFTFSSGLKLGLNHSTEINDKTFLKSYFIKRLKRLYKAYIGYTLLAFIPLYVLSYISIKYLNLKFDGIISFWNNLNLHGLINTLIGKNIVSYQLWYLIALILITSICFLVVYYAKIETLFYIAIPLAILDIISWDSLQQYSNIWFNVMVYMPVFIFGVWYGYKKPSSHVRYGLLFMLLFVISVLYPTSLIYKRAIIFFGVAFPPVMLQCADIMSKWNILKKPLLVCGKYSFPIYLFHWPIILPVLSRLIINILKLDYSISPYVVTGLAIMACVFVYRLCVQFRLNSMFE